MPLNSVFLKVSKALHKCILTEEVQKLAPLVNLSLFRFKIDGRMRYFAVYYITKNDLGYCHRFARCGDFWYHFGLVFTSTFSSSANSGINLVNNNEVCHLGKG